MPHFSILTLIKIEIQFKVAFQSSNFQFFLLQLPPCTAVVQVQRMTPKSGFVLRLKLDLFEILPLDLFTGDSPVKIHSSVHTCPGLDKLTGFKFTRVSFWHMFFDHHEDRSDLLRSVCGSNLFRLSSDQVSDLGDEGECASKQLHSLLQIVSLPLGETIELRTCHLKINHVELYIFKHEIVWRELDVWHVSAISNHLLSTLVSPFMRSLLLLLKHPPP